MVSAADGSKTAAGYDKAVAFVEGAKASEGTDSKAIYTAMRLHLDAAAEADKTLQMVGKLKTTFQWTSDLKYKVATGETLTEDEILAALKTISETSTAAAEELEPTLAAAYKHDYKGASPDQMTALKKYGPPDTIEDVTGTAPPAKKPKQGKKAAKKPTCWKWDNDRLEASTCWTAAGTVASQEENLKLSDEERAQQAIAADRASKQALRLDFNSCKDLFGACPEIVFATGGRQSCLSSSSLLWLESEKFPAKLAFKVKGEVVLAIELDRGDQEVEVSSNCKVSTKHYRPED